MIFQLREGFGYVGMLKVGNARFAASLCKRLHVKESILGSSNFSDCCLWFKLGFY